MLLPGFSSARVPIFVRLYLAGSISIVLYPILQAGAKAAVPAAGGASLVGIVMGEMSIGFILAAVVRAIYMALETLVTAASFAVGLTSVFAPVEADESLPSIATMIVLVATALMFTTDLHLELIRGLADSYHVLPVGSLIDPRVGLSRFLNALADGFSLCLRIAAAPLVFAFLANVAAGCLNRLAPQVQAYFLAAPVVIIGGLLLMYTTLTETMNVFESSLATKIFKW